MHNYLIISNLMIKKLRFVFYKRMNFYLI